MIVGILGKKVGMAQYFMEDGTVVPVTVIQAGPCTVTQIKTKEKDGYEAVQVGFEEAKGLNKPIKGHLKSNGFFRHLRELPATDIQALKVGERVDVALCQGWSSVDVVGQAKGLGFQGVVKRHDFAGGPRTHGQSDRLRAPGSIGSNTFPGRVIPGRRMPGHMGTNRTTVQNLQVVAVDQSKNLLLVRGAVPGSANSLLLIKKSYKAVEKKT
jgi:large subunit ribosomal protein L3